MKKCSRCQEEKEFSKFYKNSSIKDGYSRTCKSCRSLSENGKSKEYKSRHYHNNKDKYREQNKNYVLANIEKVKEYKHKWYRERNPVKNKSKNKRNITSKWRNALYKTLTTEGHYSKKLGYGNHSLRKHIETSWLPGMSWENYGTEWHIDHIIPLCNYPDDTPSSVVNALSNLRPLWNKTKIINGILLLGNLNRPKKLKLPIDQVPGTIFIDLDGCIIKHHGNLSEQINSKPELLPGVLEKFNEWAIAGHMIVITTGRRESMRSITKDQLQELGIFYDHLIMGIGRGQRIIINDTKDDSDIPTALARNVLRNEGLTNVYF